MEYKFKPYMKSEILRNHLNIGGANPAGERIDINSLYLERGGKPWLGVMGEYHFARDNRDNWYKELCKMKAGGITVVATYIFWIYHEEIEGQFNFSGDLDIRQFVLEAQRAGLDAVIRIGPWAHGECRNGGFPDWLLNKPFEIRKNTPEYMELVRRWYEHIYNEVKGLFYKDGGNIIGIQIENELVDDAEHIAALKKLAQDIGFEAPLWTATGWNSVYGAKLPVDDVLPVFGAYPDAPWDESLDQLPLSVHYAFNTERNDCAIGVDLIKSGDEDGWRLPLERYPFVTCELGGGMQVTHHRRPYITGQDIYSLSLCKLGDGNNLIGYYMYKGGTNKIGKLSTLNETRATGYPNDYTAISYDFQAPISEFGEIREQYRLTNMLHMFVNDFGDVLAPMEAVLSEKNVDEKNLTDLRYAMRTDGKSGFVFVNHYQRLAKLADVRNAVINTGSVVFPAIDVNGDISFIMPFNLDMAGNILEYATAQLLCKVDNAYFFTAIDGIEPKFRFTDGTEFTAKPGKENELYHNGIKIITLTWNEARYARKLNGTLYISDGSDIYYDGTIKPAASGECVYYHWNGEQFIANTTKNIKETALLIFEDTDEPYKPSQPYELEIGAKRELIWKKLKATTPDGFVEIPFEYDCAQIYIDNILVADNFWYGAPWRIPAKLIYGKDAYLVMSEIKNDFYKEV
ncbi:MAG: beta-galactosidase [Oscillospiraceae bacterium]|nr:beta-galactosidase [Oscillospiraceae bacterium]